MLPPASLAACHCTPGALRPLLSSPARGLSLVCGPCSVITSPFAHVTTVRGSPDPVLVPVLEMKLLGPRVGQM